MPSNNRPVALITGAGKGIGRALAKELASRKFDLVLASLPGEGLTELCAELAQQHGIQAWGCEINLAADGAVHQLHQWVKERGITLTALLNNAGFGTHGEFREEQYFKASATMLRLSVQVPHDLTWLFLPDLLAQKSSYVMNTSSSSAFTIVPYKSGYASAKTFLLNFSRAIRYELRDTPVSVSVLCPGAVPTNAAVEARIKAAGWMGRITTVPTDEVARIAIDQMLARKGLIIPGFSNRISLWLSRLLPVNYSIGVMGKRFANKSE
jgi:short-subunit dehydrogenase